MNRKSRQGSGRSRKRMSRQSRHWSRCNRSIIERICITQKETQERKKKQEEAATTGARGAGAGVEVERETGGAGEDLSNTP